MWLEETIGKWVYDNFKEIPGDSKEIFAAMKRQQNISSKANRLKSNHFNNFIPEKTLN